jgi:hypothetical protein
MTVVRVPYPSSMVIGPPRTPYVVGYPGIGAVGGVVAPSAVAGQFVLIIFVPFVQVTGRTVAGIAHRFIPFFIPVIEVIHPGGVKMEGPLPDVPVKHDYFLVFPDIALVVLSSHFGQAVEHVDFGSFTFVDVYPVKSFI